MYISFFGLHEIFNFQKEHKLLQPVCLIHGVLQNYGSNSFFQKDKSCASPKIWLKSILLLYKDLLEIESCLLKAVFEQIF